MLFSKAKKQKGAETNFVSPNGEEFISWLNENFAGNKKISFGKINEVRQSQFILFSSYENVSTGRYMVRLQVILNGQCIAEKFFGAPKGKERHSQYHLPASVRDTMHDIVERYNRGQFVSIVCYYGIPHALLFDRCWFLGSVLMPRNSLWYIELAGDDDNA